MRYEGVLAVACDAQTSHATGAVGQSDRGGLVRPRVDDRNDRRHIALKIPICPGVRQVVGHQHRPSVGRDGGGNRFPDGRDAGHFRAGRQINHRNVIIEPIADVNSFAVRADRRADGGMSGRDRGDQVARNRIEHYDRASRRRTRDDQRRCVRRQHDAGRFGGQVHPPGDVAAGQLDPRHLVRVGAGHVEGPGVFGSGQGTRSQVLCSLSRRDPSRGRNDADEARNPGHHVILQPPTGTIPSSPTAGPRWPSCRRRSTSACCRWRTAGSGSRRNRGSGSA